MISDKYKCIHIHIPKCAGTSIDYALCGRVANDFDEKNKLWRQHATARQSKKYYASKEQWSNYFKFAIIRNPFDKIVSSYNWICRRLEPSNFRDRLLFKDFIYRRGIFKNIFNPNLIIKKGNRYVQIRSSTDFIMDENDKLMIDYVGKFENLKEEWDFICKQLGVKIKLEHLNKHSRDNKHYRDYYDDETKEFVTEACKKDLEKFGYEF